DALLGAAERALAGRDRRRVLYPAAGLVALAMLVLGVLPGLGAAGAGGERAPATAAAPGDAGKRAAVTRVRLGGKTFTEQYVLVEVLRARLVAAGIAVEVASSLGSTVIFEALRDGQIDAYVDYSGTVWTNYMRREAGPQRWRILAEVE